MRCRFTPVLPVLFLVLTGCILAPEVYESGSLHWAIEIADSEARGRHGDAYLYAVEGFGLGPGGLLDPDLGGEAVFTCDHYSPRVGWVIRVTVRYSGVEVYELQGGEEPRLGEVVSGEFLVSRGDELWRTKSGETFHRRRLLLWADESGLGARDLARLNYQLTDGTVVFWVLFNAADGSILEDGVE